MEPEYAAWNAAIIKMVTGDVRLGSPIFLAIDDRALLTLWRHYLGQPPLDVAAVRTAFANRVREACHEQFGGGFDLTRLRGHDRDGLPSCVGFLAAMVLAAHDMGDDTAAGELNYFYRLRRVFNPRSEEHGMPNWLTDAYGQRLDESLWLAWNDWLLTIGWEPTAVHGGPNTKYINFPISQALLRDGDRERLAHLYRDHLDVSQRSWDRELLAAHLPELACHSTGKRLKELLSDRDTDANRFEALAEAAAEVYAAMDWSKGQAAGDSPLRIEAGLFRTEDRRGNATYSLYPRLPRRWRAASRLEAIDSATGASESLTAESQHVGRFKPLSWPLTDLQERRLKLLADGVDEGMELVLPARDFWVLIRDPDDEYSDAQASWGLPAIGEPFLLLCRPQHVRQIRTLNEMELLSWRDDPLDSEMVGGQWQEYHDCQVLRPRWDHVVPSRESRLLVETLRPRATRLAVSLEGGLSIPGKNVWLEGHPPKMRVRVAARTFSYTIRRRASKEVVRPETEGPTHELIDLPNLSPSEYEIEVRAGEGMSGRRLLRVTGWDDLEAADVLRGQAIEGDLLHFTLRGAHLLPGEP